MTGPLWESLPDGWQTGQVKHAATVTLGKMLQSKDSGGDVRAPYMRAANVQPDGALALDDVNEMWFGEAELEQLNIRVGDVVVVEGGQGGFGRAAYVDEELLGWGFQNSINRLRPISGYDGRFIAFYLIALRASGFIRACSNVVSMPHLTAEKLARIPIPLAPLEEQRAIADYLDRETARIDTLIEEQQRLIEMLRERRAAVLSAAFDTDPSTEATKVGRMLAARPSYGVLVPRYVEEAEGVPFVRVGDLLNLTPERPMLAIAPEQSDEYSRTKIVGGEVLLGVVGKMGQAALAPRWLAGANVARAVAVLRCKDPAIAPLLCAWIGSNKFLYQAELATSGDSIQPTLGMKDLARFDINLPTDPNAAADLISRLAKIDTLIIETERFIELARERRAALITAAVTGQIDVREMV
ncbi:restriction endonuclease subunit S [Amycolatopsis sp. NPDC004625]|uniref:restriction endonuclease subunit S n=1 Tax=Amycolatopsis sp. NPDC004625 TaxID=3154670 RepID=UPI00339E95E1